MEAARSSAHRVSRSRRLRYFLLAFDDHFVGADEMIVGVVTANQTKNSYFSKRSGVAKLIEEDRSATLPPSDSKMS